jgi:predicted amidohydrolase
VKRLLIRNGRVVDPSQGLDQGMDLLLENGVVAAIGERLDPPARTKVFDAAGKAAAGLQWRVVSQRSAACPTPIR